jgi:hypothetical protein
MFRLRYFTIVRNPDEYKLMSQGARSLGQLYDVQNEINTSKKRSLGPRIYYDNIHLKGAPLGVAPTLLPNIGLGCKNFNTIRVIKSNV